MTNKKSYTFADSGFTLFEIMLVITIVALVSSFGFGIISSVKGMSDTVTTQNRMTVIAQKAQDYYRGHGDLPDPVTIDTVSTYVPTAQSDLDLEQKYRLDAWGQYFEYYQGTTIVGVTVNGKDVAGVLISGGPNEVIDTDTTSTTFDSGGNDDILVPINVSAQAVEVALEELKVLQDKVFAYDKAYADVDNDNDGSLAGTCEALGYVLSGCPSSVPKASGLYNNDPTCGFATLDEWTTNTDYTCTGDEATVLGFIVSRYGLGDIYKTDPWGNAYVWGNGSTVITDAGDPRYRKFYSYGPDGSSDALNAVDDDITP